MINNMLIEYVSKIKEKENKLLIIEKHIKEAEDMIQVKQNT